MESGTIPLLRTLRIGHGVTGRFQFVTELNLNRDVKYNTQQMLEENLYIM